MTDRNGTTILVGDYVEWTDPDGGSVTVYKVTDVRGDIVCLENSSGECEALGEECEVIMS